MVSSTRAPDDRRAGPVMDEYGNLVSVRGHHMVVQETAFTKQVDIFSPSYVDPFSAHAAETIAPQHGARQASRPRERRSARSSSRSGDSGDDGPAEPEPAALALQRHRRWGCCSPSLIRLLEAVVA